MSNKLTLGEWNKRLPRPRSHETVRRWIRAGKIYPAPVLDGREYLFDEQAVRIDTPCSPTSELLQRITNGTNQKPRKARSPAKPLRP
ncbi:TPA: excisionase [Serratia marcescens]|uniref:excisionase n=1 Tax=Serratia marcescens TaxID=615 RepID=UPI001867EEAF|nr:excisionase [Serratia marcescens]